MNWFKRLFHRCTKFRWEWGYGYLWGGYLGGYQAKVCVECGKFTGDTKRDLDRSLKVREGEI